MDEIYMEMLRLGEQGFNCSQILMALVLDSEGKENPELLRAMGGLVLGLNNGKVCGCLTGGASVIGYYTAKGDVQEVEDPNLKEMIGKLIEWFEGRTASYNSTDCTDILEGNMENVKSRCPMLVRDTFDKVMEILEEYGYEV